MDSVEVGIAAVLDVGPDRNEAGLDGGCRDAAEPAAGIPDRPVECSSWNSRSLHQCGST
jgi:hypothetical protein